MPPADGPQPISAPVPYAPGEAPTDHQCSGLLDTVNRPAPKLARREGRRVFFPFSDGAAASKPPEPSLLFRRHNGLRISRTKHARLTRPS